VLQLDVFLNGQPIERVNSTKCLGITIDDSLNWKTHTNALCSTLAKGSYVLRNLDDIVDTFVLRMIYHGNIQSHLFYGIIFWGSSSGFQSFFDAEKKFKVYGKDTPLEIMQSVF
jgi:hypothetical protein